MKFSEIYCRVHFHLLVIAPFALALTFVALIYGCSKQEAPKTEAQAPVSFDNLRTAYGRESKMADMYVRFVRQAQKERNSGMAALFNALQRSEAIHAGNHMKLLRTAGKEVQMAAPESVVVGSVPQTLKRALSDEQIEAESMYPELKRTAEIEKLSEVALQFDRTLRADQRHAELLRDALAHEAKVTKAQYFVCPICGYILTSAASEGCPICGTVAKDFEKISS